jgi:hypothetical protein
MQNFKLEEVLDGLAELADMLVQGYLTKENIVEFKQYLEQGLTIKEAQEKVIWENTI